MHPSDPVKVVLQGYECHHLYDLGRHIAALRSSRSLAAETALSTLSLTVLTLTPKISLITVQDHLKALLSESPWAWPLKASALRPG